MAEKNQIPIHYIKIQSLETKVVTGAIGGITGNALINMDLFIDRVPIPQTVNYEVIDGIVRQEMDRIGKDGLVREVHTSVVFDIRVAKALSEWLDKHIKILENQQL